MRRTRLIGAAMVSATLQDCEVVVPPFALTREGSGTQVLVCANIAHAKDNL
jgi:hypothetical protein